MVSFSDAIKMFYNRYTDFQGRSTRAEYWWMQLLIVLVAVVFGVILGATGALGGSGDTSPIGGILLLLIGLIFLGHIVGLIALAVRRFHDLDQTGWLVLVFGILGMIPLIGFLISIGQIIWFAMPGTKGANKYGDDPFGHSPDVFN